MKIRVHSVPAGWYAADGLPPLPEEEVMKQESAFPPGWDEDRVHRALAHYEEQAEEEAVAEDEAAPPLEGEGEGEGVTVRLNKSK
jgi:hypothetical protein